MRRSSLLLVVAVLALLALSAVEAKPHKRVLHEDDELLASPAVTTALQDYVARPDSNFKWEHCPQFDQKGWGYKIMWLNMTSQRWLTDADVSQSIWVHWVAVVVPDSLSPTRASDALLWIGGNKNSDKPPAITDKELVVVAAVAQELRTVAVAIFAIPNAPVYFWNEQPKPRARSEDALIAYAWQQYIQDPVNRAEWLPRLPMTKASIRAMDAATEFWSQSTGSTLTRWIVAGASKRGWTTWTVAACDPQRVVGIVPMVLDQLNFVKNIKHHYRAYGGWSFALSDYYSQNFTAELDSPGVTSMMQIIDPINYASVMTMPKMILSTGGDEFLLPDNVDYFWNELQGEKHFHLFPNCEHTLIEDLTGVVQSVKGFAWSVLSNTPRPEYQWSKLEDGTIHVEVGASTPPSSVKLWSAWSIDGNARRDFRLVALMPQKDGSLAPGLHPVFWNSTDLAPSSVSGGTITYDAFVAPPSDGGWVAFVVELQWAVNNTESSTPTTFRASSAPSILPNTFPYPECEGAACYGTLV